MVYREAYDVDDCSITSKYIQFDVQNDSVDSEITLVNQNNIRYGHTGATWICVRYYSPENQSNAVPFDRNSTITDTNGNKF